MRSLAKLAALAALAITGLILSGVLEPGVTAPATRATTTISTPPTSTAPTTTTTSDPWAWHLADPVQPAHNVTNPATVGLNLNGTTGRDFHDYFIDGGGDSSVLLENGASGNTFERFHLTRVAANPAVTWAMHGFYVKAPGNGFTDLYIDGSGGHCSDGLSVRMRDNTFTRTVIKGCELPVAYFEHDGAAGTVVFKDGNWYSGENVGFWGDDSNDPPAPYVKQSFVFENVKVHVTPGGQFGAFGPSAYVSGQSSFQGESVQLIHDQVCDPNCRPATASDFFGVPASKLHISW